MNGIIPMKTLTLGRQDAEYFDNAAVVCPPMHKKLPAMIGHESTDSDMPHFVSKRNGSTKMMRSRLLRRPTILWRNHRCVAASLRDYFSRPTLIALIALSLGSPKTFAAADPLDSLIKRPLFQPDKQVSVGTTSAIPVRIEFGGYLIENGVTFVSLTDTTNGQSTWVRLKDTEAPFFVEALDRNTPAVTVKLNGQAVTLRLRQISGESSRDTVSTGTPRPEQAVINDSGEKTLLIEVIAPAEPAANPGEVSEPNRIPRQSLRIPKRIDDPT